MISCALSRSGVSHQVQYTVEVRTTQTEILLTTEEHGKTTLQERQPRDMRETRRSAKDAAQKVLA